MIKIMSAKEAVEITKSAHEEIMNREMEECRERINSEIRAAALSSAISTYIIFYKEDYCFINDFYKLLADELIELGYTCTIGNYTDCIINKGNKVYAPHIRFNIEWKE